MRKSLIAVLLYAVLQFSCRTPNTALNKTHPSNGAATDAVHLTAASDQLRLARRMRIEKDLRLLTDDNLEGRGVGSKGLELAALIIMASYDEAGVKPVYTESVYSQEVPLLKYGPGTAAKLTIDEQIFTGNSKILPLAGYGLSATGQLKWLDMGSREDFIQAGDLSGMIVVTQAGDDKKDSDPRVWMELAESKARLAAKAGAVGMVEIYAQPQMPLGRIAGFFNRERVALDNENEPPLQIPLIWVATKDASLVQLAKRSSPQMAKISLEDRPVEKLTVQNVIGLIPGTDPELRDQYIAVSAHYDHIGIIRGVEGDSINNGARDNGLGTVLLLEAAREFSARPTKRPILLLAWTAEEVGLLGSEYYMDHPAVPLEKTNINLNFDGAGYDDTTAVTINGYGFTTAQALVDAGVKQVGLTAKPDPVPQYNLFRQSDNYSFAKRDVPAMNIAPGFTGFSPELLKYYHQPADEVSAIDFDYVEKYVSAGIEAIRAVANASTKVEWVPGVDH